jgi:hypothetical protein
LLRALLDEAPEEALVIVTFRTYCEEFEFTCMGVASIDPCPEELASGTEERGPPPLSWRVDPASCGTPEELAPLVLDTIRGRGGRNVARLHPVTREMYRRMIAKREDHQRRLDWSRENPDHEENAWFEAMAQGLIDRFEQSRLARVEKERQEARARSLLLEVLSPAQAASLQEHGHFEVRGRDGRNYRIKNGFAHNVFLLDEAGTAKVEYCIITRDPTPLSDHMLAQKLLLESCPEVFHEIANFRDLTAPSP